MQIGGYSEGALLLIKVGRPFYFFNKGLADHPINTPYPHFRFKIYENNALLTQIWTFSGLKIQNYTLFDV